MKFKINNLWPGFREKDWHFHFFSCYKFEIHHHASVYHEYLGIIILNIDFCIETGGE